MIYFDDKIVAVFPASAGVILNRAFVTVNIISFPRIRGGDPADSKQLWDKNAFSPHPRG